MTPSGTAYRCIWIAVTWITGEELGGAGYLTAGLLHLAAPALAAQFARALYIPGEAGEALMGLWLIFVGVNAAKRQEAAAQTAAR